MPTTRKRKAAEINHDEEADTTKSVLGGMRGGYRVDGTGEDVPRTKSYSIPYKESKSIPCELRGGPQDAQPLLIFTHGAGGGISNPATVSFAEGFAFGVENAGQSTAASEILCFQGTMNLKSRVDSFRTVIEHEGANRKTRQEKSPSNGRLALGGRSMGARAAVMTASDSNLGNASVDSLVLVSYPLKSPKGEMRDQILLDIAADTKVLFVVGSEDNMCALEDLQSVRKKMKAPSKVIVVEGADHGMSIKVKKDKENVVARVRRKSGELARQWLTMPDDFPEEVRLSWNMENEGLSTKPDLTVPVAKARSEEMSKKSSKQTERANATGSTRKKRKRPVGK